MKEMVKGVVVTKCGAQGRSSVWVLETNCQACFDTMVKPPTPEMLQNYSKAAIL